MTGALVVADPEALRVALPSYFAQSEQQPDGSFVPRPGAERFDSGWVGGPSLAGLSAALEVAPEWRFERAAEMAAQCRAALAERFEVVTKPDQAGLVTFRPETDPTELVDRAPRAGRHRPRDPGPQPDPGLVRLLDERRRHRAAARGAQLRNVRGGAQPELGGDRAERLDHEPDVVVELDAELLGTLVDVVAIHAGRK